MSRIEKLESTEQKQLTDIELFDDEEEINEKQRCQEMQDQLEQIEQEDEEIHHKQYDLGVQAQLEQLERSQREQQLAESNQILYYEWIQDSELFNKQVSKQMASSKNRNEDDNDEQEEEEKVLISFLSRFQQQQWKEEAEDEDTLVLARTSDEKLYFPTLQSRINETTIVRRPLKHSNVLCIFSEEHWNRKVNNYMEQTGNFSFVGDMSSDTSPTDSEHILTKMSNLVVRTLHILLFRRAITNEQYSAMMYYNQSLQYKVNRLDFIPIMYDVSIFRLPLLLSLNPISQLE